MDLAVLSYALYLVITVPVTIWVGRTLSRNGKLFLVDVFTGREDLAQAVNSLLVVGFYLLNLGFVALFMSGSGFMNSARVVVEHVSIKVGVVLLVLGVIHLANVWVFNRYRRRALGDRDHRAPVPPAGQLVPQSAGPLVPPPPGAGRSWPNP